MDRSPAISVCIPCYEMRDGLEFLKRSFEMLEKQSFKDFEVVISDDSINDAVEVFVKNYKTLPIRYIKNMNGRGMAENTNCSLLYAEGSLLKILYQDDFLAHEDSLKNIVENFPEDAQWLVTGCAHKPGTHTHLPTWDDEIYKGKNTIGSPSVLTVRNHPKLELFENKLSWVLDCDYYYRLYKKYGLPIILNDINVVIGVGEHQTTHLMGEERKEAEIKHLIKKYDTSSKT